MAQYVATFDPLDVAIVFGGHTLDGYGEGTFVDISRESDLTNDVVGADGTVSRAKINDKRGNVKVTLLASSSSNKVLTQMFLNHEAKKGEGSGAVALSVKNGVGKDLYTASESWILKPAAAVFSNKVEMREWTIRCADLKPENIGEQPTA